MLCALLICLQSRSEPSVHGWIAIAVIFVAVISATVSVREALANTVSASRNFYGPLRVIEMAGSGSSRVRTLIDGTTLHGIQVISKQFRRDPPSYYTPGSGIGRVLTALNRNRAPLRVGVIGLGAGTLAAYGRSGDIYRFYEINPAVIMLANSEFTFLIDSAAAIQTVLGDARLKLEREPPHGFDLLVIDAFSSDSIPVHLLTREALILYRKHVRDDGVIAFDISNRFVNLAPVVEALAASENLNAIYIVDAGNDGVRPQPSKWVLIARTPGILDEAQVASAAQPPGPGREAPPWTDDFNSLLPILK